MSIGYNWYWLQNFCYALQTDSKKHSEVCTCTILHWQCSAPNKGEKDNGTKTFCGSAWVSHEFFIFIYFLLMFDCSHSSALIQENWMITTCRSFGFRYDNVPPEINRLRCRVNYHALKFLPEIEQMADLLASRMRNRTGSSNYMYVKLVCKFAERYPGSCYYLNCTNNLP